MRPNGKVEVVEGSISRPGKSDWEDSEERTFDQRTTERFKGLSIPNAPERVPSLKAIIEEDVKKWKNVSGSRRDEDEIPDRRKRSDESYRHEDSRYERYSDRRDDRRRHEDSRDRRETYRHRQRDDLRSDKVSYATGSNAVQKQRPKRLSSPERFEIKQLIASGVLKAEEYAHLLEEAFGGDLEEVMHAVDEGSAGPGGVEENVEIELCHDEPNFLRGQTNATLTLSPIKIVKNPEGSLNRAAMAAAGLASERREIRTYARENGKAGSTDAASSSDPRTWHDPIEGNVRRNAPSSAEARMSEDLALEKASTDPKRMPEWKRAAIGNDPSFGKTSSLSIREQRESLPIFKLRDQLIQAVRDNPILVVIGDTGSGKTTQMTQYLAECGFTKSGMIGCTQPRRVAATSVAKRVAEEIGCRLGEEVGYTIRFEDATSPATRIKYMTDGMLLRECLIDPELRAYSVIMLDEAHERTIHTDVLFGLLKQTIARRPNDLRLIVTSATLDAEKFSGYFGTCPIFTIPGRTYPVEVLHSRDPEPDYLDASLITVMQIHLTEPAGDILLFLTGQEEIDTSCEVLYERMQALGDEVPPLIVLPVYSALPSEMQSRIFEPAPPGSRKVVVATNIAETSLTIDGIYYVIDPGFCKQKAYNPKLGMNSLIVTPISQAQARQRAGRAGRTGPGKCYRLYTERAYAEEMLPTSIPEIQRTSLATTVLTLKAMGINDLIHFDFMDPPPIQSMVAAMESLYALGALDEDGFLTRLGRKMAEFPLDPPLSKMLLYSVELGCSEEVLTLVAMLSVDSVFYRPKDRQSQADQEKSRFNHPDGDHLTLLAVFQGWSRNKYSREWCYKHFIQARSMQRALDIRKQLVGIMQRYRQPIISCGSDWNAVRQAVCAGFFGHAARRDGQVASAGAGGENGGGVTYKSIVENQPVYIHPSSAMFGKTPEWVVYHELVLTSREYMRTVTTIDPRWLVKVAPTSFRHPDPTHLSQRKRQEKIVPLYKKFEGPDDWRLSKQKTFYRRSTQHF